MLCACLSLAAQSSCNFRARGGTYCRAHPSKPLFCWSGRCPFPLRRQEPKSCDPAGLVQVSKQPKCPKVLKGECERCVQASGVRVTKQSLARCQTVFWGVSPGAKQGLHGARDLFGTLTPEARKHLSHSPLSTFGHFGCFDTCTRPAGSQPKSRKSQTFSAQSFSRTLSGHGRPHQQSWAFAPKHLFSCGPGIGHLISWHPGAGSAIKQSGRERKGPPKIIPMFRLRNWPISSAISLWLLWMGPSTILALSGAGFGQIPAAPCAPSPFGLLLTGVWASSGKSGAKHSTLCWEGPWALVEQ